MPSPEPTINVDKVIVTVAILAILIGTALCLLARLLISVWQPHA